MKVKVKYWGIGYNTGNKLSFNVTYNSDVDFIVEPTDEKHVITAEKLADFWVRDIDKSKLLYEKDLLMILDWKVLWVGQAPKKNVKAKVKYATEHDRFLALADEVLSTMKDPTQAKYDFMACYKEMKGSLKGMKAEDQVRLVMSAMVVAVKSAGNAYKYISDYQKKIELMSSEELNKHLALKNG